MAITPELAHSSNSPEIEGTKPTYQHLHDIGNLEAKREIKESNPLSILVRANRLALGAFEQTPIREDQVLNSAVTAAKLSVYHSEIRSLSEHSRKTKPHIREVAELVERRLTFVRSLYEILARTSGNVEARSEDLLIEETKSSVRQAYDSLYPDSFGTRAYDVFDEVMKKIIANYWNLKMDIPKPTHPNQ